MQTLYLGKPFVYPQNNLIGRRLEKGQEWDSFLRTIIPALVEEEEPTICEVGANIGASLRQILAAKPHARVLAFEPVDHFRSYLLRNIEFAAPANRVRVYPHLVGSKTGAEKLHYSVSSASAVGERFNRRRSNKGRLMGDQIAEMVTLDAVLAGERVHFIKVDTDGFDFEVLRGAVNTLKDSKPSLHVEFATFLIPEPIQNLAWLQGLGYKRLLCLTPRGKPIGITEDPSEAAKWAQDNRYCDIVTCPEGSEAEARLLSRKLLLSLKLRALLDQKAELTAQLKLWTHYVVIRRATHLTQRATHLTQRATHLIQRATYLIRRTTRRTLRKATRRIRRATRPTLRKATRRRRRAGHLGRRTIHRLIGKLREVSRL